ncbi:MAG: hypothetical protein KDD70_06805 [Bdellovibrionales bacterium]|nr:hypothetical protein [Bdellovibrionales bacterium]
MNREVTTSRILMIEPVRFRTNEETLSDNALQHRFEGGSDEEIEQQALREFRDCVALLRDHGINVSVFTPHAECESPDAVFCSHWFTTHLQLGGLFVTYPMRSPKRRTERSPEIVDFLKRRYPTMIDLTQYEEREEYLEGTGSLVFDRVHRVAYMASSTRSTERLASRWASLLGYRLLLFNASGRDGRPIFHTELIISLGDDHVMWCPEVIAEESLAIVRETLEESERELIEISREQLMNFLGSMVSLGSSSGRIHFLSSRAYNSMTEDQRARLEKYGKIVHTPLDAIEQYGGGSAASMIAELV